MFQTTPLPIQGVQDLSLTFWGYLHSTEVMVTVSQSNLSLEDVLPQSAAQGPGHSPNFLGAAIFCAFVSSSPHIGQCLLPLPLPLLSPPLPLPSPPLPPPPSTAMLLWRRPCSYFAGPPHTEAGGFQTLPWTQFQNFTFESSPTLYTASRLTPLVAPAPMEMSTLLLRGSLQVETTSLLRAPPETHPKMRRK